MWVSGEEENGSKGFKEAIMQNKRCVAAGPEGWGGGTICATSQPVLRGVGEGTICVTSQPALRGVVGGDYLCD